MTPSALLRRSAVEQHPVHTISFDLNGAVGLIPPVGVSHGDTAPAPRPDPRVAGHTFLGWHTKPTGGLRWDFSGPSTATTTLYAQWAQNTAVQISLSPDDAAVAAGTILTVTGTVSPATATGVIELFDGSTSLGRDLISGDTPPRIGTLAVDTVVLRAGEHSYTAVFTPLDGAFLGSRSAATTVLANRRLPQGAAPAANAGELLQRAAENDWPIMHGHPVYWSEASDCFVDAFFYHRPLGEAADDDASLCDPALCTPVTALGTLGVARGVLQRGKLKLPDLAAGHYLALVGQTSGAVAITAPALAQSPAH